MSRMRIGTVDWFRVFQDLSDRTWTLEQISLQISVPPPTLRGWKQGAAPRYEDGVRLLDLWCGATGQLLSQIPRVERQETA